MVATYGTAPTQVGCLHSLDWTTGLMVFFFLKNVKYIFLDFGTLNCYRWVTWLDNRVDGNDTYHHVVMYVSLPLSHYY